MPTVNMILGLVVVALGLATIILVTNTFFTVHQRTAAIVQRFGKFAREVGPGIHASRTSIRIRR